MSALLGEVRAVLDAAIGALEELGADDAGLRAERAALDRPLRVALAGRVKAGKSTLLNALVGEPLAPTDAGECTRVVTHYRHGQRYRAEARTRAGERVELPIVRGPRAAEVDLSGFAPEQLDRLVVEWPSPRLRTLTLVDTPGTDSPSARPAGAAPPVVRTDVPPLQEVDAVIYLLRHLHACDRSFLEAFRDRSLAPTASINAVGVLSRADEVGGGGLDAMDGARAATQALAADPLLRSRCGTVVPVAGLLAQGAATLREQDFAAVVRLAARPRDEVDEVLRTAERLARQEPELAERLGLFGTRLSVALVRLGEAVTSSDLAERLAARSGVVALRTLLDDRFVARSSLLKAHHALAAVQSALDDEERRPQQDRGAPPEIDALRREVERIGAAAHPLAELHLLAELRDADQRPFADEDELAHVERLLGATGPAPTVRLGLPAGATHEQIEAAAVAEVARWRRRAAHPLATPGLVHASEVLARTAEGLLDAPSGF